MSDNEELVGGLKKKEFVDPGHTACQGCGEVIAMRHVFKAIGDNAIATIPAGCSTIISGAYPRESWNVPIMHTAFETAGASISGIEAALKAQGKDDVTPIAWAGDGGTADIGLQALSGAIEREHDIVYIMADNEAYMNTGIQRSSSTPYGAWTTTTPVGKNRTFEQKEKKNVMDIVAAHDIPYAASANIGYLDDLTEKVKKAKEVQGPGFVQIYTSCPTGWKMEPKNTVGVAKKAVKSRMWNLYEYEDGQWVINVEIDDPIPVEDYLMLQGRFRHLKEDEIQKIQEHVDDQWEKLLKKSES